MNLAEFGSWGLAQGSVANPAPNYKYKGQCVSLIQQYLYQVFGMQFKARGNAKDWAYNIPDGFTKLGSNIKLQKGDILVYGSNYGGGYGHIGLIDVNGKYYDQNGIKRLAIGYRDNPFSGYICVLRPNNQKKLGLNADRSGNRIAQNGTFTASVNNLNVRRSPSLSGQVVAQYDKGESVKYDSYIDSEGYRWISYVGKSGNRNYIARRKLDNSQVFGTCR
jgi:hypothetical protein